MLIEGVPGHRQDADRALARRGARRCGFNRIQFTVDLMPADITGTRVLDETPDGRRDVRVRARPGLHARAARRRDQPRDAEDAVGAPRSDGGAAGHGRRRRPTSCPSPFFVLATLNPIEMEGTYQLPEAQLDRFLFKVRLDYPSQDELERILARTTAADTPAACPCSTPSRRAGPRRGAPTRWSAMCWWRRTSSVTWRAWSAARSPRPTPIPRCGVGWRTAPARAAGRRCCSAPRCGRCSTAGRTSAIDDVTRVARAALQHRLVLSFAAETEGVDPGVVIDRVLAGAARRDA